MNTNTVIIIIDYSSSSIHQHYPCCDQNLPLPTIMQHFVSPTYINTFTQSIANTNPGAKHSSIDKPSINLFPIIKSLRQFINHDSSQSIQPSLLFFTENGQNSIKSGNYGDNDRGSCRECLITGVLTCTGLSAYFFHLATELRHQSTKQIKFHRNFLYGGSATWAAVGTYRLYLG